MIGLSARTVRACLGQPAKKLVAGSTQVWIYPVGAVWVEGGLFSPGVNGLASLFGNDVACNVQVVLTNAAVSEVNYSAPDGGPLRYRVALVAKLWKPGQQPRLEAKVLEGSVGLSI